MTAFERVIEALESHGCQVHGSGRQRSAQCPAHEDRAPSLSVTDGTERVLMKCHAGCDTDDVLAALSMTRADLFDAESPRRGGERWRNADIVAVYDYHDENGNLVFQVCRTSDKQFPQRVPDPAAPRGYRWGLAGVRPVPYCLPALIAGAAAGGLVICCEGEKDVHSAQRAGAVATCNPMGAGSWKPEYARWFKGAAVWVVADRDEKGRAHARTVRDSLLPAAASVEIREAVTGKDLTDHLDAGHVLADLKVTWRDGMDVVELAEDLHEFLTQADDTPEWVIPDVIERNERLMITGGEGKGKSLFTRQLAVCAAAGIHPFTHAFIQRQKVLFIDCENPRRFSRFHFRRLSLIPATLVNQRTGESYRVPEGGLRLIHRPEGLDLSRDDAAWLLERVTAHKPDLLVIGPLYRLHVTDLNDELAARVVVNAIDAARLAAGCAVIIEAHAPHQEYGRTKRALRPAGSSLFLRWPEMGYGIRPLGTEEEWDRDHVAALEQWRGPRQARPNLPARITWGNPDAGEWPWIPAGTDLDRRGWDD